MAFIKLILNEDDHEEAKSRKQVLFNMEDRSVVEEAELKALYRLIETYEIEQYVDYDFELEIIKMHDDSKPFTKAYETDLGWDIYAYLDDYELKIPANGKVNVPSGIKICIPDGWGGIIENRSGLSTKHGLDKLAGVVDSFYVDQIFVCLQNNSDIDYYVKHGDRVGQIIFHQNLKVKQTIVTEFSKKGPRSHNGFGSSGR